VKRTGKELERRKRNRFFRRKEIRIEEKDGKRD
jgi:hypothetical protein